MHPATETGQKAMVVNESDDLIYLLLQACYPKLNVAFGKRNPARKEKHALVYFWLEVLAKRN